MHDPQLLIILLSVMLGLGAALCLKQPDSEGSFLRLTSLLQVAELSSSKTSDLRRVSCVQLVS